MNETDDQQKYPLLCIGRDGMSRTFEYRYSSFSPSGEWTFKVTTIPPLPSEAFFEITVTEIDAGTVQVTMANHFNIPEYMAMGIPEALLPEIKEKLGMNVVSSPPTLVVGMTGRNDRATNYWKRLVKQGGAYHDSVTDIYTVA